jgi:ketosteroid isomerase-like protein
MSERQAILFANTAFYAAFAARDYAAMDAIWAEDDVGCVHPGWPPLKGRKAVMASWRNILGNPASPEVAPRDPVILMHGVTAIVICLEIIGDRSGGRPQALSATNIFVKEKGGWKIVHHHAGAANVDVRSLREEERPPVN